jgi:hypothetical protein
MGRRCNLELSHLRGMHMGQLEFKEWMYHEMGERHGVQLIYSTQGSDMTIHRFGLGHYGNSSFQKDSTKRQHSR